MRRAVLLLLVVGVALLFACDTPSDDRATTATDGSPANQTITRMPAEEIARRASAEVADPEFRRLYSEAERAFESGRLQAALDAAEAALRVAPHAREPYILLSRICLRAGEDRVALAYLASASEANPSVAHAWFYRGFHEFRDNRWQESATSFERAARLAPDNPENHFRHGTVLHSLGEFEASVEALRQAHRLEPGSAQYAIALARELRVIGDYQAASDVIEATLRYAPDSSGLHFARGQIAVRRGDDETAEASLRRATELGPGNAEAFQVLAGVLRRRGSDEADAIERRAQRLVDYDRYRDFLIERRTLLPQEPKVPLLLAWAELTVQGADAADDWLDRAEALGAQPAELAAGRAWAHTVRGDAQRAAVAARGIADHDDPYAGITRAAVAAVRGDTRQARRQVERVVQGSETPKELLYLASDVLERIGDTERAIELSKRASAAAHTKAPEAKVSVPG